MKKKIFTIAFALLIICTLSITVFANVLGDINGDGKIAAADARLTLRYAAGLQQFSDEQIAAADIDGSGKITASDARRILREAAGLTNGFGVQKLDGTLIEEGVLNVAICAENQPFAYAQSDDLKGINVEMAKKVADYYGLELKLHSMSAAELADSVKNKKCDIAFVSVDHEENNILEGVTSYQYYHNRLSVYFKDDTYPRPTIEDLKGDVTKKVGVVRNSIADVMVTNAIENGELNCEIKKYNRFIEGKQAVKNREIDAFIGYSTVVYQGTANYDNFVNENMLIVAAADNQALLDSFSKTVDEKAVKGIIAKFCPAKSDSRISLESGSLVIPEGGTSVMRVYIDSYYGHAGAQIISSPFETSVVTKEVETFVYEYYLVISIPKGATDGTIKLAVVSEPDVSFELNVQVLSNVLGVYNFGIANSQVPDFGTIAGVSPEEVDVETKQGEVSYRYSAETLSNAGADNSHIKYFFTLLEYQGFSLAAEESDATHKQLTYKNATSGETVKYIESYKDSALEDITILLYHKF